MQPHRPRLPSPPLLRLLVLVLLLHALVLWGLPTLRSWPTRPAPPSLHTRWVALAPRERVSLLRSCAGIGDFLALPQAAGAVRHFAAIGRG